MKTYKVLMGNVAIDTLDEIPSLYAGIIIDHLNYEGDRCEIIIEDVYGKKSHVYGCMIKDELFYSGLHCIYSWDIFEEVID